MAAAGRGRGRSSIHRSAARDRDEEGDQCMQSALGEGDREGNNFCANLEDRDKETEVLGGALLMLDIGADFPLGPRVPECGWLFRSQRRFVGRMGVKRPEMGPKRRFLGEFATWVITAQLLLRTIFMSRIAFHERQARIRRKFRIHINLRRKHGSPNFCRKRKT